MSTDAEFIKKLEARGEAGVREDYEKGIVVENRRPVVEKWLAHRDRAQESKLRGIEVNALTHANEIAQRALAQAEKANRIAIGAFAVAFGAALVAIFKD